MTHDHPDHLDPEIVAAWVDGSLDSRARAEAEAHAADCGRCQAVLAAMIRTEPPVARKPGWLGAPLRWLVPLATATAVVGIWILVSPGVAPATRSAPVPIAQAPQTATARQAPVDVLTPLPATEPQKRKEASPTPVSRDRAPAGNEAEKDSRKATPPAAVVAETVTLADQRPPQGRLSQSEALAPPPVAAAPPVPAPPPPPPAASTRRDAVSQQETRDKDMLMSRAAMAPLREVRSPDQATRWLYGPSGTIQRSPDGGKTWATQPSSVTTELIAASAPSSAVCWMVGRAGVVLLSTDGATWRRLPFPEAIDLRAVTATDARAASVTAADGRVFRTTDGGVTWLREEAQETGAHSGAPVNVPDGHGARGTLVNLPCDIVPIPRSHGVEQGHHCCGLPEKSAP